jgi:hypothetical protein
VAFEEARVSALVSPSPTIASVGVSKKRKNEEDKTESAKKQFRSTAVSKGKQTPNDATSSNSKYHTKPTDSGIDSANDILASINGIKRKAFF